MLMVFCIQTFYDLKLETTEKLLDLLYYFYKMFMVCLLATGNNDINCEVFDIKDYN